MRQFSPVSQETYGKPVAPSDYVAFFQRVAVAETTADECYGQMSNEYRVGEALRDTKNHVQLVAVCH